MRTLSSRQTLFAKVISPVLWLGGWGALTLWLFVAGARFDRDPLTANLKWMFLILWLVGAPFAMSSMRFKRVRLDASSLRISNYLREAEVPLATVEAVSENLWLRTHPVTIQLDRETPFGQRIVFMPKARLWAWWAPHPIVSELRDAAGRARGREQRERR